MKKYKKILKISFIITDIIMIAIVILPKPFFSIRIALALISYVPIRIGAGGLLENKIFMRRGPGIKYGKDSTAGKAYNVISILTGVFIILCSIFMK
ncbi:MAG: hypothetical protein Q8900_12030 [Bacillota bacterium]|nr:hypothetical protein [Bacillota bacterium]